MKGLENYKDSIHKCSKCGLCQAVCPIYKVTGNDCTVSRGQFVMLSGVLNGQLKMSPKINDYLDLCLKCGACSKYCPSGIDVLDVISAAKYEYLKLHSYEKFKAIIKRHIIFGFIPRIISKIKPKIKSKTFEKKVLFFGGCGSRVLGNKNVVKLLNNLQIEVVSPDFDCCGIFAYTSGDLDSFKEYITSFVNKIKQAGIYDIVTSCASCEKTLKDYIRHAKDEDTIEFLSKLRIKNIYSYIKDSGIKLRIKKPINVTFHKPCNLENYQEVEWILENTENLNYIKMNGYDQCCGLNGLLNINKRKIIKEICNYKMEQIKKSEAKIVLTACLGCEAALKLYSNNKYKVLDLLDFLSNESE